MTNSEDVQIKQLAADTRKQFEHLSAKLDRVLVSLDGPPDEPMRGLRWRLAKNEEEIKDIKAAQTRRSIVIERVATAVLISVLVVLATGVLGAVWYYVQHGPV